MMVTVINKQTGKKLTMQELLEEVNRDRSGEWIDYTEDDDMVYILRWLDYDYFEVINEPTETEVIDEPTEAYEYFTKLAIDAGLLVKIDGGYTIWTENPPEEPLRNFINLFLKNQSND